MPYDGEIIGRLLGDFGMRVKLTEAADFQFPGNRSVRA